MNALIECSILVICIVIANTTANRLTDGSLSNEDYGNDDDTLRQQLEQNKNLLASLQTQIQQLEGHKDEMKQLLDAHQRELHDQKHELVKVVHALLMRGKDDNLDRAIHNISKKEIPSAEYTGGDYEELITLLRQSGVTGPPGKDGKDGKNGRDGEDGRDGKDGEDGRDGYDGEIGEDGEDGKDGEDGDNGHNAIDGAPGPPGPPGPTGVSGNDGTVGPQGPRGPPGDVGEVGKDGVDGANGHNARAGAPGPAGPTGVSGNDGPVGPQGPRGLPGADNTADVNAGAVYTRWGRTNCPSYSTLVYEGFAGSTGFNVTGGGTNHQCLPTDPEYNKYSGSIDVWHGSLMAGAEYQSYNYGVFPSSAHDQNVPCARCYTQNRAALMMIPGKRTCPDNWTKEYEGYLMASREIDQHPSTFQCVDSNPEYITGRNVDSNGALFSFTKTICSGWHTTGHCPPYIANRVLTCVVCTQ